jgi:hypothetical protein
MLSSVACTCHADSVTAHASPWTAHAMLTQWLWVHDVVLSMQVIRRRLDVHNSQAQPVKNFYEKKGKLMNFEITGGIPETLPLLYNALRPHCGNWTLADFEAATMASATTDSAVPRAVG